MVEGHLQDFTTLAAYLKKFTDDQFLEAMSDLHVLIYIAAMDMLPLRVFSSFLQFTSEIMPLLWQLWKGTLNLWQYI